MSNFLAIAAATASLKARFDALIGGDVSGATVTVGRPRSDAPDTAATVNIFLFQVTPNASWRNADLPNRRAGGEFSRRPAVALDLHYLFTFRGDENELVPQRLLGSVVSLLHAHPVLTRGLIRSTVGSSAYLAGSALADDVELVKFTPRSLSLEELSRLWSTFLQTPYALSVAYLATVVLIERDETPVAALPVRERGVFDAAIQQPRIEQVANLSGLGVPVVTGSTLLIRGQQLRGEQTRVLIGDIEITPNDDDVSDRRITLTVGQNVPAGVHGVQVVHLISFGTPPAPRRGPASGVVPLLVHPAILLVGGNPDIVLGPQSIDLGRSLAELTIGLDPPVGRDQRAVVLLNEVSPPAGPMPRSYVFDARPRPPSDPPASGSLVFPTIDVSAGTYLVRVQVDGAATPLQVDETDQSPTFGQYVGPRVVVP